MSGIGAQAVILATGTSWESVGDQPSETRAFLDRPFGRHVVEALAGAGVQAIHMVIHHRPEEVEAALGDGSRWGIRIEYHLARDGERPLQVLRGLGMAGDGFLLGRADTLPDPIRLGSLLSEGVRAALMAPPPKGEGEDIPNSWTGWAWVPRSDIGRLQVLEGANPIAAWMLEGDGDSLVTLDSHEILDVRTPAGFMDSIRLVLGGSFHSVLRTGRELQPGVRIGRNARVHPSAVITGPAHLGEDCWIGPGASIGPFASVGRGAMVGKGSSVIGSVLGEGSYAGDGLSLEGVIVEEDRLVDTTLGVTVEMKDRLLLGTVTGDSGPAGRASILSRASAAAALTVASPLLLLTMAVLKATRPGPVVFRREILKATPRSPGRGDKTFLLFTFDPSFGSGSRRMSARAGRVADVLLRFLPGLLNVARGDMGFVGVEPRSPKGFQDLPKDWQGVYGTSDIGLVTEAEVRQGPDLDSDGLFAAESYYTVVRSPGHKLTLLRDYFLGRGRKRKGPVTGTRLLPL